MRMMVVQHWTPLLPRWGHLVRHRCLGLRYRLRLASPDRSTPDPCFLVLLYDAAAAAGIRYEVVAQAVTLDVVAASYATPTSAIKETLEAAEGEDEPATAVGDIVVSKCLVKS